MTSPWLHRYAVLLAVCTLFLILAGASVTSSEAGLSVPDWPLSYGEVMPPMEGKVFYEHGHRMVASAVGFMTVVLAIWLWRADPRGWMRKLGWAAVLLVIAQGVLGGMTVRYLLPRPVSISHACIAQLFFSLTVAMAVFTSAGWRREPVLFEDSGWPSIRSLAIAAPILVLAQIALGAGFRHRAFGIMPHVVGAFVVTALVLMVAIFVVVQFGQNPDLRRSAISLMGITCVQVLFGVAAYLMRMTAGVGAPTTQLIVYTVIHVAVGALTMAASVVLAIHVLRSVRPSLAPTGSLRPVS